MPIERSTRIIESKLSEHYEHGRIGSVTATGKYEVFDTAFGAVPTVVVTGEGVNARLAQAPVAGSFKVELDAAGTAAVRYMAWGER